MSALKSLMLAIDLGTRQRDQLAMVLAQAQRNHAFAQDQMGQLKSYAAETEARWTAAAQGGVGPELMRHHLQFMGRLEHAMTLQTSALEASEQKVGFAKQKVLAAEFRLTSLKQVLTQKQAEVSRQVQRQEQKEMDEFASQRAGRSQRIFNEEASP